MTFEEFKSELKIVRDRNKKINRLNPRLYDLLKVNQRIVSGSHKANKSDYALEKRCNRLLREAQSMKASTDFEMAIAIIIWTENTIEFKILDYYYLKGSTLPAIRYHTHYEDSEIWRKLHTGEQQLFEIFNSEVTTNEQGQFMVDAKRGMEIYQRRQSAIGIYPTQQTSLFDIFNSEVDTEDDNQDS